MKDKYKIMMPVESHQTDKKAINQVSSIFIENNHSIDIIASDYGEDLLVQPSFDETVEHFKVFIQVKGTANIEGYRQKKSKEIVRSIDFAHMLKWLRSKELCVLVLWDTVKKEGLFYLPKAELNEWDFYTQRNANIRVAFNEANILTEKTVPQLIWRARYEHYAILISHAKARQFYYVSEEDKIHANSMFLSVCIDFFLQVKILIKETLPEESQVKEKDVQRAGYYLKICDEFERKVFNACNNLQADLPDEDRETITEMAVGLSLVITLEERTGTFGVPSELLEPCIPELNIIRILLNNQAFPRSYKL